MHQIFCCLLFKTAYIPLPSHGALNFDKQTLNALRIGEGMRALILMHAMLLGRQQNLGWNVLGIWLLWLERYKKKF